MERKLLTTEEVAEALNTTRGAVFAWVHRKRIPYSKIGRRLFFDIDDIRELAKKRGHPGRYRDGRVNQYT